MGAISALPPLSVVIPTLDAEGTLASVLASLASGDALIREIVIADGGSRDGTALLARQPNLCLVEAPKGRGAQLAEGARTARAPWLCFLHADTRLESGWSEVVSRFIADPANRRRAGYFRYRLDDAAPAARRLERMVGWRNRALGLPYGDQGLLIAREYYDELGGFLPLPLMEDVAIVRRIGRARLVPLEAAAITSAERYRRSGYLRRSVRNLACLGCYLMGVPPRLILRLYG